MGKKKEESKGRRDTTEERETLCHQQAVNLEAETPMPMSHNLDVDKTLAAKNTTAGANGVADSRKRRQTGSNGDYIEDGGDSSTASDVLRLYGKKNTARVKLSISYSENGTRSYLERTRSIEDCLETDEDFRFQAKTCRCLPKRYVLALLSFMGFFNVYCLRVDLSVTLVAMTTNYTRVRANGSEYTVSRCMARMNAHV